ncbi:YifB family Mg chelatase-like AAA ATPase [Nocardioides lijunqiniae]|uniref:YifB family Mg chelatase-like AAA ATPase n=1 Tax=Nocardioides lijunqiniae TaxID=2760832 RepID=UPI0018780275|nr:YifB family Mg chelatase-like AAA ATPase [Nocardioides lijunqiniae]
MPFATTHTVSLHGAMGHLVDVQADVSPGQVGTTLVGRPDASLSEARDRCRMAVINSELGWPSTKRITILLSPADLLKRGSHFDLAIAVAVVAADGRLPVAQLQATGFIGELTLDGGLRCVPGVLPMVLAAAERGIARVFVPEPLAREASMVPGMDVFGMRSLAQVVAELQGEDVPEAPPVPPMSGSQLLAWRGAERLEEVDLADLRGMADAKYAVEVAAAGGHHLLLSGPKGSGKTSIAERIPTILPPLTTEEALELTAIHSLAGTLDPGDGLLTAAPYAAPHHDASKAALIGGGSGHIRPGEISRAHCGVLFLDEFPLFRADVIEALRQPLESGDVTIARREELVTLPARGMLVLASNPCPCGEYHPRASNNRCTCAERVRRDYRAKITGPLADRIDIVRHVEPVAPHEQADRFAIVEPSAVVRARVAAARLLQAERYAERSWRLNAHAPGPVLREAWPLEPEAQRLLDDELFSGRLSSRGAVRVHRVAWTVADLTAVRSGEAVTPGVEEVQTALLLRTAEPLPHRRLEVRAG